MSGGHHKSYWNSINVKKFIFFNNSITWINFASFSRNLRAWFFFFVPSTSYFFIKVITPIVLTLRIKSFEPRNKNDRGDQTGSGRRCDIGKWSSLGLLPCGQWDLFTFSMWHQLPMKSWQSWRGWTQENQNDSVVTFNKGNFGDTLR